MANPYLKQYLMTAGPTPLPPSVSQVMAEPILYHRAPAFIEVYARALGRLKMVFQTENEVLSFASSGSGGMESAVANLTRPGEPALVVSCGKFGERWAELCEAYGAELVHHDVGLGREGRARRARPAAGRELRRRGGVHHAVGDLHRRGQRRQGADRGRPPPRRADRGRRGLGPRRGAHPAGRVGRRRGGGRLAEGADDAARAWASPAPTRPRWGAPPARRAAATTSTG